LGNDETLWADLNGVLSDEHGWDQEHLPQAMAGQLGVLVGYLTETYLLLDFNVVVYGGKVELYRFEHRVKAQPEVEPPAERVSRYQRDPVI